MRCATFADRFCLGFFRLGLLLILTIRPTLALAQVVQSQPSPGYRALSIDAANAPAAQSVIGSNDASLGYKLQVNLTPYGAAVWHGTLTDYPWHALDKTPYAVLAKRSPDAQTNLYHLAAAAVWIDRQPVDLMSAVWTLKASAIDQATYSITIADSENRPIVEIQRTYRLSPDSYQIRLEQTLMNLTKEKHTVQFSQLAQGDIPADEASNMGDKREWMAGYFNPDIDASLKFIYTDATRLTRDTVLDHAVDKKQSYWPIDKAGAKSQLVWLATVNRYFALVTYPPLSTPSTTQPAAPAVQPMGTVFSQVSTQVWGQKSDKPDSRTGFMMLTSSAQELAAGQSMSLPLTLYAGPRDETIFKSDGLSPLMLDKLVLYDLGSICSFCTFQWLAKFLLAFMTIIHLGLFDWALAIVVLVVLVRAALHPITRRSQIGMAKMQKQMASLQPELDKLKKKYKDDQQGLQMETMRLYRERGVNPMNMLGCLPMFLQMPIWFALYAMLFYAIELRQVPAIYGVFQAISGGHWKFLADLSVPDNFILFPDAWHFSIPMIGPVTGIHLLPILMGVLFFYQQKMMAVPAANEQAAQQQKMMKWMTLLFPLFLYGAPSGLNFYIMASTLAGLVDSWIVKRHIKKEEAAGTLFAPPKPKNPNSLMARIQKMVEERQQDQLNQRSPFKKDR